MGSMKFGVDLSRKNPAFAFCLWTSYFLLVITSGVALQVKVSITHSLEQRHVWQGDPTSIQKHYYVRLSHGDGLEQGRNMVVIRVTMRNNQFQKDS